LDGLSPERLLPIHQVPKLFLHNDLTRLNAHGMLYQNGEFIAIIARLVRIRCAQHRRQYSVLVKV
jgi:hypothetical protein